MSPEEEPPADYVEDVPETVEEHPETVVEEELTVDEEKQETVLTIQSPSVIDSKKSEDEMTSAEQSQPSIASSKVQSYQHSDSGKSDSDFKLPSVSSEEESMGNPLDELSEQALIDLIQEMESEKKHLQLENLLFTEFIQENDPTLLEGLDELLEYVLYRESKPKLSAQLSAQLSKISGIKLSTSSFGEKASRLKIDSYTSLTSIVEGKGPKLNISHKIDMVMRAMEDKQQKLSAYLKKCHIAKRNLKAELEEFSIRETEINEAMNFFEFNVVTQGVDPLTQRIPAEKFVRFMDDWLRSATVQMEKLRLRIATLKIQYRKVSVQLMQREELRKNVHAVDFDQLEIENQHFLHEIDVKNEHLLELKTMLGNASLVLSKHKKMLQKQQDDSNRYHELIIEKEKAIEEMEKKCKMSENELNEEIKLYENCKSLKQIYQVPEVMDYVYLKKQLFEMKKSIKMWTRRKNIQEIALNTCVKEMKSLTGSSDVDLKWFDDSFESESNDAIDWHFE